MPADLCPYDALPTYLFQMAISDLEVEIPPRLVQEPVMRSLNRMTLDKLKALETARYACYVDWYDYAGMDLELREQLDEVRIEIEKRLCRVLTYVPADRASLVA
jgi:hypothetical protein